MSGNRNLSYAQLSEAFSWFKTQEGEEFVRLEDEGADLTEVMIRLGNGAYRAPLPRLVDRGPLTPEEIAIQAEEDETTDEDQADCADDEVDDDHDVDALDTALWHQRIGRIGIDEAIRHAARSRPKPVFLADMPMTAVDADEIHDEVALEMCALAEHDSVDHGPNAISGWQAAFRGTDELRLDNGTGGYRCWKDTTKSPTQFMRHSGRIQPTFRRKQARAA